MSNFFLKIYVVVLLRLLFRLCGVILLNVNMRFGRPRLFNMTNTAMAYWKGCAVLLEDCKLNEGYNVTLYGVSSDLHTKI